MIKDVIIHELLGRSTDLDSRFNSQDLAGDRERAKSTLSRPR